MLIHLWNTVPILQLFTMVCFEMLFPWHKLNAIIGSCLMSKNSFLHSNALFKIFKVLHGSIGGIIMLNVLLLDSSIHKVLGMIKTTTSHSIGMFGNKSKVRASCGV